MTAMRSLGIIVFHLGLLDTFKGLVLKSCVTFVRFGDTVSRTRNAVKCKKPAFLPVVFHYPLPKVDLTLDAVYGS